MVPIERAYDLSHAMSEAHDFIRRSKLSSIFSWAGVHVVSCRCDLFNISGNRVSSGYGKGTSAAAKCGALFEAIEHFLTDHRFIDPAIVSRGSTQEYLDKNRLKRTLPLSLLDDFDYEEILWIIHQEIGADNPTKFPLILAIPSYADALFEENTSPLINSLSRYSTNNGIAVGSTLEEAMIHGLLEAVERHSLSQFLLSTLLIPQRKPIQFLNATSLPEDLAQLHALVELELCLPVALFSMPNEFGVPTFGAVTANPDEEFQECGFGSSLSKDHALRRALFEVVQCSHAGKVFRPTEDYEARQKIRNAFVNFPFHMRCAKMNIIDDTLSCTSVQYEKLRESELAVDPSEYFKILFDKIHNTSIKVYFSTLFGRGNGPYLVRSYFDGLDPIFAAVEGALVFSDRMKAG